jgi:hypothetical protein
MEKYDYRKCVCDDIRTYINENCIEVSKETQEDLYESLYDKLWVSDQVTGNASGSYTFNTWRAEENLCHNMDLLVEAIDSLSGDAAVYVECLESAEVADVTIRCYLLSECLTTVLDELCEDYEE